MVDHDLAGQLVLRDAGEGDRSFLSDVYASTRMDELAVTDWRDEQKRAFCQMQFDAQAEHYRLHYPGAKYSVIELNGERAGRLYVDRWSKEIRIMDIAILPAFRSRGIGACLLRQLQAEAAASEKILSIHVERMNPALRLYERLGFTLLEDKGIYLLLSWRPETVS